ncbi:hypothetical protein H6P81_009638 [Aristolochia fimbriata]|uniref:Uncharacterized protein n=1 Tax=Aristolochia fimbriata TaxID=158543 RepID=A0AAV7EQX7_ARIFI|nr:hypothetical protein H6P81_009638 [Aristolochia fimbriata]
MKGKWKKEVKKKMREEKGMNISSKPHESTVKGRPCEASNTERRDEEDEIPKMMPTTPKANVHQYEGYPEVQQAITVFVVGDGRRYGSKEVPRE